MEIAVDARDVVKAYALGEASVEVLRGLSLRVPAGQLVAVMGPSGVGKSTLLNCLAGLELPDAGALGVLGEDTSSMDDRGRTLLRRRRLGIIYQFFNLVSNLDVEENLMLPYLIDDALPPPGVLDEALEMVGMTHRRRHLPSQLSGGEMQLVSIARALVRRPRLILADEPTGNVNVATGRKIMGVLQRAVRSAGAAMILVTHNPYDAAKADRVVFMEDGLIDPSTELVGDEVSLERVHARLQSLGI